MVCKKCEKKLTNKAAAADPFRNRDASGTLVKSASGPVRGGALSAKASSSGGVGPIRSATSRGSAAGPLGTNKLLGSKGRYNPVGSKCTICKSNVSQEKATYCQSCAYKRGVCAICGKLVADITNSKQSVT